MAGLDQVDVFHRGDKTLRTKWECDWQGLLLCWLLTTWLISNGLYLLEPQQHEEGDGGEAAPDPLLEGHRAVTVIVYLGHHVGQDLKQEFVLVSVTPYQVWRSVCSILHWHGMRWQNDIRPHRALIACDTSAAKPVESFVKIVLSWCIKEILLAAWPMRGLHCFKWTN